MNNSIYYLKMMTLLLFDERFKTYEAAKDYAKYISVCGAYVPKHGCQDWLLKLSDGEYACILHLYDLSIENFGQNNKRAWIGFATKKISETKTLPPKRFVILLIIFFAFTQRLILYMQWFISETTQP